MPRPLTRAQVGRLTQVSGPGQVGSSSPAQISLCLVKPFDVLGFSGLITLWRNADGLSGGQKHGNI